MPRRDLLDALDDALTPAEVARKLGVHLATVYRWMFSGVGGVKLRSHKVGGRKRLILRADLEAFVRRDSDGDDAPSPAPSRSAARGRRRVGCGRLVTPERKTAPRELSPGPPFTPRRGSRVRTTRPRLIEPHTVIIAPEPRVATRRPPDPPRRDDPLPPDGPELLGEILRRHILPALLATGDGTVGGVMEPAESDGGAA